MRVGIHTASDDAAATVLVLADAPGSALRELLDNQRYERLQRAMHRLTAEWAQAVAPGRTVWAVDGPGGAAARVAAMGAAFERHGGPLLVVRTDLPRLSPAHAAAALLDLQEGGDVAFGPTMDGGWYLVALADPRPELFALSDEVWEGPVVMARTLEVAQRLGLEVGLLRMERRLATAVDVTAYAADPLTPGDVRDELELGK